MTPLDAAWEYAALVPVFPCDHLPPPKQKRPLTPRGFHDASQDREIIKRWWTVWPNALIGMPTGKASGRWVLDIDVKRPTENGFDSLEDLGYLPLPETPMAHTASGGVHVYFNAGHRELRNSAGLIGPGLDVRGCGGYAILPSPGSGYFWDPIWNLETVPMAPAPDWLWPPKPSRQPITGPIKPVDGLSPYGSAAIESACNAIARAGPGSRNARSTANASASALPQLPDSYLLTSHCERSCARPARCPILRHNGRGAPRRSTPRFAAPSTPARNTRGRCAVQWLDGDPEAEAERQRYKQQHPGEEPSDTAPGWQPILIDVGDDLDPIPPRAWLLGTAFCREFVSSLLAAGATGKTACRIAQLLALATGRPLTGEHVFIRCRVMLIGLEDGIHELRRRVRAAMQHYDVKHEDVRGWFYIVALPPEGGKLVSDKGAAPLKAWVEGQITEKQLDLLCFDPLVKTHDLEENDNGAIERVIGTLASLAITHNLAVDAPHHISKGTADPGNADRGRGASSFKDGGRLVYTLAAMSEDEAEQFGIGPDDRQRFIRLDAGKVNLAASGKTKWFELLGVKLGNHTDLYPQGDEIQVAAPWQPPDTWAGLSSDALNAALTDIDGGLPDGRLYSDAPRAKDTAAWQVVQKHCSQKYEAQCREIIKTWVKNRVLYTEEYTNPTTREKQKGLRLDPAKRPS